MLGNARNFRVCAYFTLAVTLLVILWGAFVRLSGSGDGCGASWPLCQGVLIPKSPNSEMIVEFLHRMSSGLAFMLVLGLFMWSRKIFVKGSVVRSFAAWSLVFMISESLIGAALVLFEWVDQSTAPGRVGILVLHQVNTFLLISAIVLTARSAGSHYSSNRDFTKRHSLKFILGYLLLCLTAVFGVIAALGSMLYPAPSLLEGMKMDFISTSPVVVRIRILHPLIAVVGAMYLWWLVHAFSAEESKSEGSAPGGLLLGLLVVQLVVGFAAWLSHGPVLPKLFHLLLADLIVASFTAFGFAVFAERQDALENTAA